MDLSEYNGMMETKRLLEETNKKLESAYEDNKKLQQEKVDALKANEHTVTMIETKRMFQSAYIEYPEYEIRERLSRLFNRGLNVDQMNTFGSADGYSRALLGCLYKFEDHTSTVEGEEKVYSTELEKIREEMRRELKNKLDADTKNKLAASGDLSKKVTSLLASKKELEKDHKAEIKDYKKIISGLEDEVTSLKDEKKGAITELEGKVEELETVISFVKDKSTNVPRVLRKGVLASINLKVQ